MAHLTIKAARLEELGRLAEKHGWEVTVKDLGRGLTSWYAQRWEHKGTVAQRHLCVHVLVGKRGGTKGWRRIMGPFGDTQVPITYRTAMFDMELFGAPLIIVVSE